MASDKDIHNEKSSLRTSIRRRMVEIDASDLRIASERVCMQFVHSAAQTYISNADTIAIFASMVKEINLSQLHEIFPEKKFLYPLCQTDHTMSFHHVRHPSELISGAYGINAPDISIHPEIALQDIDLIICPGLAFGVDGSRLGQGGGYYDRVLQECSEKTTICGICIDEMVYESLPSEPHDISVSVVITEANVYEASTS